MSVLIKLAVAILVFVLIFTYLLPLLAAWAILHTVVKIILVLAAIIYLCRLAGVNVG